MYKIITLRNVGDGMTRFFKTLLVVEEHKTHIVRFFQLEYSKRKTDLVSQDVSDDDLSRKSSPSRAGDKVEDDLVIELQ